MLVIEVYILNNKKIEIKCTLCGTKGDLFNEFDSRRYYNCPDCKSIFMDPQDYLTSQEEEERYKEHNNDINDSRYQEFVAPIVKAVQNDYRPNTLGLDYGCGTGPVITKLLNDKGYKLNLYDPYFADYPENLKVKYDYIVCCEVIEHFYNPKEEFQRLNWLLKPGGAIFMKTEIYDDDIDFDTWYYKNDPTHVFFYSQKTLECIQECFQFSDVIIEEKYIKLIL